MGLSVGRNTAVAVEDAEEVGFFIGEEGGEVGVFHVESPACVILISPHMCETA
jgi:hypothetical protein